jgi:hypothetical protein
MKPSIKKRRLQLGKKTVWHLKEQEAKLVWAGGTKTCTLGRTCTQTCPSNPVIC